MSSSRGWATPSPLDADAALKPAESTRGVSFRLLLSVVVVGSILFAAGGVGLSAYLTGRDALDQQWRQTSGHLADLVTERTQAYLAPAVPWVALTRAEADRGRVNWRDAFALFEYLEASLLANPGFTWSSFGSAEGTFIAARRTEEDGISLIWRVQQPPDAAGEAEALEKTYRRGADGDWEQDGEQLRAYDPRRRPWYRAAVAADRGVWIDPYLFASHQRPGFSYCAPQRDAQGRLAGVWAIDYELTRLSEFLAKLEVGRRGRVYVLTQQGDVVGHPTGEVVALRVGKKEVAHASDHGDPMLVEAWGALRRRGVAEEAAFTFPGHVALARPFPEGSGIGFIVLTVIPEDDLFGNLYRQVRRSALIAAGLALLAVLVGIVFAQRVSREFKALSRELERIGRFELSDERFGEAGSPLREVNTMNRATDTMKQSLRSFARYVPGDLVRQLLQQGEVARVGGQTRAMTVMFADIVGFTTIAEGLPPGELLAMLAEFLDEMSLGVRQHQGTVDKYLGDAIMAFWGAPQPLEDHAGQACLAALAMRDRLHVLQELWRKAGSPVFEARLGINSGPMLVGNVGSSERLNYTVMGDAVNLASRLEGLNKVYGSEIMLGQATAEALDERFLVRPLDYVAVKGKAEAIRVYELVGLREQADERVRAGIAAYGEGLEHYRARRFAEAGLAFAHADEALGGDPPARLLAERCERYATDPPPADWDGRTTMTSK